MLRTILLAGTIATLAFGLPWANGDIIVRNDGALTECKVVSRTATEVVVQADPAHPEQVSRLDRQTVSRIIITDEHGGALSQPDGPGSGVSANRWITGLPPEPVAPPINPPPFGPTYYVIPLHGVVGETVLAGTLEKSLADAVARKPTVVVLDIDSPGGLVEEAQKILKVLHHYNKLVRIVALTDKDLSAAAIITLSAKEIYVKPSSTIGAATSFQTDKSNLPAAIEEKMQSAWRATARNSAEEGGHEPLLAEAMIDNDLELHLESVAGKNVVKAGPGEKTLCRKGKVLTLTSHEAIDCGLAVGGAEDFADLGKALKLENWEECKGLGTLLAEGLAKRMDAFKTAMAEIGTQFEKDIQAAVTADPSAGAYLPILRIPKMNLHRTIPGIRSVPWPQPFIPPSPETRAKWKARSLTCVVALQGAEQDIADAMALCEAVAGKGAGESLKDLAGEIAAIRARIYDERNKYGGGTPAPALALAATQPAIATEIVGAAGGGAIKMTNAEGKPVIGLQYRMGEWGGQQVVQTLEPVFAGVAPTGPGEHFVAKAGYALGGLCVLADDVNVLAVQAIFMRLKDNALDPTDSYRSPWLGTQLTGQPKDLLSTGKLVIGLAGRKGMNLAAVGLVFARPPGVLAATQPAIPTELVGAAGGSPIKMTNLEGKPVIGLRYRMSPWAPKQVIQTLEPAFAGVAPTEPAELVLAKDGYALGGLCVLADDFAVFAVQAIFMRLKDNALDPNDLYRSGWLGGTQLTGQPKELRSTGRLVIGLAGRKGMNLACVGLVFARTAADLPATQPADPTELLGAAGGDPIKMTNADRKPVIGLQYRMGEWGGQQVVQTLDPMFAGVTPTGPGERVVAKEGYGLGGLCVLADNVNVLAVQAVFMRLKDKTLDPSDSYRSGWLGTQLTGQPKDLLSTGKLVIGLAERKGFNLAAIALEFARTAADLPATQPADPTELVGGAGGDPINVRNADGKPVIGLRYRMGERGGQQVIQMLEPVFAGVAPTGPGEHFVAKAGYALGGLCVLADDVNVLAIQAVFMRLKDRSLDPNDSYRTPWLGTQLTGQPKDLLSTGKLVIGLAGRKAGRKGLNLGAIGLVFEGSPIEPASVPAGRSPVTLGPSGSMDIDSAEAPPGTSKTEWAGGPKGGAAFMLAKSTPTPTPVTGFSYSVGNSRGHTVFKWFLPIYEKPDGAQSVLLAKDGYVVGGLVVDTGDDDIRAIRVIFVRFKNGKADVSDTYKSEWLGTPTGVQTTLAGKGETVVGIYGRKDMFRHQSIGLVILRPAGPPATAPGL